MQRSALTAEDRLLCSRIDDMIEKARRGRLASSAFMTPEEVAKAKSYLRGGPADCEYAFYGGYGDAERKMLVVFPEYILPEYFDTDEVFRAVFIRSSGHVELDHRSYLGALMNLSIKRETLGDIIILSDGAVVFCTLPIAAMLTDPSRMLERVGRDKVSVSYAERELYSSYKREYESLNVIMASLRLDCAVAALTLSSRSLAQEKITRATVQINHRDELSPSAEIAPGDILSIRGAGKFIIESVCGETRSGRLRVEVKRYT